MVGGAFHPGKASDREIRGDIVYADSRYRDKSVMLLGCQWVLEIRWIFTPLLMYGFETTFRPVDLLMGTKSYLLSLWVRICSCNTRTHKPMCFLIQSNLQYSAIVILFF